MFKKAAVTERLATNNGWIYHVLAWLTIIAYETCSVFVIVGKLYGVEVYVLSYSANILLFYCNAHLVFKGSFRWSRYPFLVIVPLVILELLVYIVLCTMIGNLLLYMQGHDLSFTVTASGTSRLLWRGIYYIMLSIGYWFGIRVIEQQKDISRLEINNLKRKSERLELERNLMQSQNAYLQSQLNPHFLFNTLNYIYDCVYDNPAAARSIILLSDMMRFSMEKSVTEGNVKVVREIAHIENFIALNQLRFNNKFQLTTEFQINDPDQEIIPLLLLSFVENVFKHGDFSRPDKNAFIGIYLTEKKLRFISRNPKKSIKDHGFGLGLKNNKIRLDNFYPGKFSLSLKDTTDQYEVCLSIDLDD